MPLADTTQACEQTSRSVDIIGSTVMCVAHGTPYPATFLVLLTNACEVKAQIPAIEIFN